MQMVTKEYFKIPSSDGLHQLNCFHIAQKKVRATLQIEHGVAEHIERYIPFAMTLAEHGIAVFADDHLGHGKSVLDESEYCWFSEQNGWEWVCDDVRLLSSEIEKRYSGIPHILMGHSMGSFIVRTVACTNSSDYEGLIISGTGQQSSLMVTLGRMIARIEAKRLGSSKAQSGLIQSLAFGPYNKKFAPNRTEYDWLTRDEAEVDKYINDPLCGRHVTIGLFYDMLGGIGYVGNIRNTEKMRKDLPVYIMSGDMDPVGGEAAEVKKVYKLLLSSGLENVTMKIYKDARHELLNGPDRQKVTAELLEWIDQSLEGGAR